MRPPKLYTSMLNFHFFMHLDNLCSKSFKTDNVIHWTKIIIGFIFYAEVRWLTRINNYSYLQQEIRSFFASKSKAILEFKDKE
ncbi:hypothetical protein LAZ67_1001381 [Cordylochernes scorpioides]|uniref:ATP synthase F0 subunit 8 n=1 Tax=Cordylochernes scorpioides TaxID=51811 RepID=A0ABY6JYN2_9ARAC|nr:hypothetical protein LAZ67_1001381 [Cordylochernes scorpioides]